MFKRPKGVSDIVSPPAPSSARSESDAPPAAPEDSRPADARNTETEIAGTRAITPSYQARKTPVRTLQPSPINTSSSAAPAANLHVGRGLKLEGKIQSCDSLVIEGDVQATIESGTLTITESGEVRGDATVEEAEVNGKFDGTLTVKKCLTINSSGRVTGKVRYGELKVEQGGQVSGEISAAEQDGKTEMPRLAASAGRDEKKTGDEQPGGQTRSASLV
ncbi:MAG: polymer-forming cytoskeletal protein [Alphaproteobacteria bacterium]|nr:polymer-forming cytoskeletal protein [Alphaproteobacteria bacterium]MDX5416749.1 polymer-forming cytoskeletal protein [Alphaproteobacteria bacterium]MDX5494133.1 polymer-forming cytoskeletal protein [Alphaproteobacteria bacterium]